MDELYQKFAQLQPKEYFFSGDNNALHFHVTELWRHDETGAVKASSDNIAITGVKEWLVKETRPSVASSSKKASPRSSSPQDVQSIGTESLILRLVWVPLDFSERRVKLPDSARKEIVSNFGLDLAYNYSSTRVAGINSFSRTVHEGTERQAYAFTYAPKLAAIWSHTRPKPDSTSHAATRGIILAQEKQIEMFQAILKPKWSPEIGSHPMFPAILISLVLSHEIERTQSEMKKPIQGVEARTGYSQFQTKRPVVAPGELGKLSAEMSGHATRLASAKRKSQTIQRLTDFIKEMSTGDNISNVHAEPPDAGQTLDTNSLMVNHASVIQERLAMQTIDREFILKRLQIQIEALVNLIAQTDSVNNMDIALSSHRDASSMKTLAFVTMLFLPGSFIAALFSTDCFDWDSASENSIGVPSTRQFELYWAITIPLTLLTFISYFAWLQFSGWQRNKQRSESERGNQKGSGDDDESATSAKSKSTFDSVGEVDKLNVRRRTIV